MKYLILLCLFLSISFNIQAQAVLEKTYSTTELHRVNWALSGERYWYSDDSLKVIQIFSKNHESVKTIRYPSVLNSQVRLLRSEHGVTQTHLNGDDLLEMIWVFKDTVTRQEPYKLQIRNERDSVLFTVNTLAHLVYFSEIEGLPTKLLIATWEKGRTPNSYSFRTTVYNVPNIQVDTIYFDAYYLHRKKFGYAGEKYFYKDVANHKMLIFNANHSLWKKIELKWSGNINMDDSDIYTDADDNVFSKDSLVEVIYSYKAPRNSGQIVVNEYGYQVRDAKGYQLRLDHQMGLKDKLFVEIYNYNDFDNFKIYSLPDFNEELRTVNTSFPWQRTRLKKYGETYFSHNDYGNLVLYFNNGQKAVKLYNNRSIIYPYSIQPQSEFPIVSDSIVNRDTLVEVIYAEREYINNIPKYTTKIINETGTIYNTIDSTRYFAINHIEGLSDKLITKTGNDKPFDTKVWGFKNTTATKEVSSVWDVQIYPNPFSQSLTIDVKENVAFPLTLRLTNALGQVIWTAKTHESKIDVALPNMANGVYLLEMNDGNKRTVREVVKMGN